jgi:Helicase conserved C-terminal domain
VILATTRLPEFELPLALPADDTAVVEWRHQLMDRDTSLLNIVSPPILHEVPFRLTSSELALQNSVRRLCNVLEKSEEPQFEISKALMRALQSSPAAVERLLRRLVERLATGDGVRQFSELSEEELAENRSDAQIDPSTTQEATIVAEQALARIDEISSDSKLSAFWEVLRPLAATGSQRICVLTDYQATLFYLAAEIEGRSMNCMLLHGGMNAEDRKRSLESFANKEGILVATTAAATDGDTRSEVTDLVLYDIPGTRTALLKVLPRFDWMDRRNETIHALTPAYNGDSSESEPLRLLREILVAKPSMRLPG